MAKSSKVTFTDALCQMARASSSAKANEWGVEPHHDVMTSELYIAYIFDNRREATSMATQLKDGKVVVVPPAWKKKVNAQFDSVIMQMRSKYYGVYCTTLQIDPDDLRCTPHLASPSYTVPHV